MTIRPNFYIVQYSTFVLLLTCLQNCQALVFPLSSSSLDDLTRPTEATDALLAGINFTQYPPTTTIPITRPGTSGTVVTALETAGHESVQPFPTGSSRNPESLGTVVTALETFGHQSVQPFPTVLHAQPTLIALNLSSVCFDSLTAASTTPIPLSYPTSVVPSFANGTALSWEPSSPTGAPYRLARRGSQTPIMSPLDIFKPIATGPLPSQIYPRSDHPIPKLGITGQNGPIPTNKFYANLILGTQGEGVWTHPYSVAWSKGNGYAKSWGLAVSHVDANQRVYGPPNPQIPGNPVQYFINPIRIQSLILSATELGSYTVLTTKNLQAFSVNAVLQPQAGSASKISFPLLQGMGFVTGKYSNLQPAIQSSICFRTVVLTDSPRPGIFKYRITLEDGKTWLLYITPSTQSPTYLRLISNTLLQGPPGWSGTIQVAKNPAGTTGEYAYDRSAGIYPTSASISGQVLGQVGTYTLSWEKSGLFPPSPSPAPRLLMFALPHHIASFRSSTAAAALSLKLQTTTKGIATAVLADSWTMVEADLPISMGFAPWTPSMHFPSPINSAALNIISQVAAAEMSQNMDSGTNLDSMYFSGKSLSKYATLVYSIHDFTSLSSLAADGLARLKAAFARFVENRQSHALVYDTVWKGVVSEHTYISGDLGADFGNTGYNDHHFHYGYFIHAASIIGYLDPTWIPANKEWVNMLIRDAGNPSSRDPYFPVSRMFDWYHGHSFAKGLYESADGKDEESSSEDGMFAYAVKMWGRVSGDAGMGGRGDLMLAVLARTLRSYFLMESGNEVQPGRFVGNKVAGILFENKIDHTTYFGNKPEYIHGIHTLPILPFTPLTRSPTFIHEEYTLLFSPTSPYPLSSIQGGWKGLLYANLAIVEPRTAWRFFSQRGFEGGWIDGGASRTWYLVWCAGLGGAS